MFYNIIMHILEVLSELEKGVDFGSSSITEMILGKFKEIIKLDYE